MAHIYKRHIKRIINPHEFENNCHKNFPDHQLEYLKNWHDHMELDGKSPAKGSDYLEKASIFQRTVGKEIEDIEKSDITSYLGEKSESGRRTYKATPRQFFLWYYLDHKEREEEDLPRFVKNQLKVTGQSGKDKFSTEDVPKKE